MPIFREKVKIFERPDKRMIYIQAAADPQCNVSEKLIVAHPNPLNAITKENNIMLSFEIKQSFLPY